MWVVGTHALPRSNCLMYDPLGLIDTSLKPAVLSQNFRKPHPHQFDHDQSADHHILSGPDTEQDKADN